MENAFRKFGTLEEDFSSSDVFKGIHQLLNDFCFQTSLGNTTCQLRKHPGARWDDFGSVLVEGPDFKIEKIDRCGDNPMLYYKSEKVKIFVSYYSPEILSTVTIGNMHLKAKEAISNGSVVTLLKEVVESLQSSELWKEEPEFLEQSEVLSKVKSH